MASTSLSPEFLDELRSKCDIVDVVGKYVTLNRRGGNHWACCPFHNEKTPSFAVKEDGQFFKCFGCGESGNVITFVMKMENVDFFTACELLCKSCGMSMPSNLDNEEMKKKKKERDTAYSILNTTTDFYHQNLLTHPNSPQALYLKKRQISDEMIEKFKIGASLDFDTLPKYLTKAGFKYEDMVSAGVVGSDDQYKDYYDFYGKRLLFPIFNGFGDVVAYSGRSVEDNPTRTKYKNTPQTAIFNKSEILFGFNFVRDLKKSHMLDTIIIVEGHIDVITCHQVGITNTIGCMGTALTSIHAKKIKQLVDNVILCLDGDSAGSNATYKAINELKDVGLNVKVVRLNRAKDPDEFIKKYGKDEFMSELLAGVDCVDFILKDTAKKYNFESNMDRNKYINEALEYISKFSSEAEREIYLAEVQKLVKVPIDALRKSMSSSATKEKIESKIQEPVRDNIRDNYILESKIMLLSSILYKKITNLDGIANLFTNDDELSQLYHYLVKKIEENKSYSISSLFDDFDISAKSLIDKVINYVFPADDVFSSYLNDTIKRIRIYELEIERDNIRQQMLNSSTDEEKYKYMNQLQLITDKITKEKK